MIPRNRYAIKVAIYACYEEHPDFHRAMDMVALEDLFDQLELLSDIDKVVVEACDCSFLYFHKALFAPLLKHMYNASHRSDMSRVQLIFAAFSDPSHTILESSTYLKVLYQRPLYLDQYRTYLIENVMLKELVNPVVDSIENVLRHRIHARNIDEMPILNPKQGASYNFMTFIELPSVDVCGLSFSIKTAVERLLEKSLYNSSTVGLKDTNRHNEMMVLAKAYGLTIVDSHLPAGAADQGMDLMLINDHLEGK